MLLCEIFCEKVWGVMLPIDCFAILLMIYSVVHVLTSRVMSHELSSLTRIHVVSTGSHPKIPPKKRTKIQQAKNREETHKHSSMHLFSILWIFVRFFVGILGRDPVLPTPTHPPEIPIFFPFFPWFFENFIKFYGKNGVFL